MKEKNKTKGITLIALVITIIVLVILAGVSVSAIINKGIISNTKIASDKYNEKTAEEKLAVTLAGAQIEKYSNKEYNQEFFLTQYIQNALVQEGVVVNGNFVIFNDGNVFEIDRSVPKIVNVIGKREKEEGIIITGSEEPSDHYTKAIVSVKASYEEAITKIIINGEEIIPTVSEDAYTVSTKVSKNGSYGVIVYAGDKYNYATIQVTVISEDMIIRTVDEFKTFRDKVNAGATFEGKTITLINDIDLNEGKYTVTENGTVTFESDAEQWIPIGTDNTQFSGTFDGQCNTIRGIYIYNNNKSRNGLFDTINEKGSVKNIILDMLVISNTKYEINGIYIGAVAAINNGVIERCQIKSNSNMFGQQEYLSNSVYIGGIVGENTNVIKECINNAKIGANQNTSNFVVCVGGIVGSNNYISEKSNGAVWDCYNTGYLYSNKSGATLIGGIIGINTNAYIKNCYNIGTIYYSGARYYKHIASVIGSNHDAETKVENIYFVDTMTYSYNNCSGESINQSFSTGKSSSTTMKTEEFAKNLGLNFAQDTSNINNGYPILKWQLEN